MEFRRRKRKHGASQPWRLSAKLLILFAFVTVIGFSAICVSVIFEMRRGEEQLARRSLENLASSIDADISRNVGLYDLSLRAVASTMIELGVAEISKSIRQLILFDDAATARHFGVIQVFDAQGQLTLGASMLDPIAQDRSNEEYFRIHREHPDVGLFISRPMPHQGAYAIVLSRRIVGEDGKFLGVVAGSIRFSYFHDLFGHLKLDPSDTITVVRQDGTVIMRTPFDLDFIGRDLGNLPLMKQVMSESTGSYSGISVL